MSEGAVSVEVFGSSVDWEVPDPERGVRVATLELPHEKLEEWRYSPIEAFSLSRFAKAPESPSHLESMVADLEVEYPDASYVIVAGGRVVATELGSGVEVTSKTTIERPEMANEPFVHLIELMTREPCVVTSTAEQAKVVIVRLDGGPGSASFSVVEIHCQEGSTLEVIDIFRQDSESLCADLVLLAADQEAHLTYRTIVRRIPESASFGYLCFEGHKDSEIRIAHTCGKVGVSRLRTQGELFGDGAQVQIRAGYVVGAGELGDFRTYVEHSGRSTRSDLLYKGAVLETGSSIYTGLITITPTGGGANAFQTNRNILLSPQASAESVPNLDIQTSNVRCSHASTVGPLEEDLVFYLQSKGIPEAQARRVLADAFFASMTGDLSDAEQAELRAGLQEKWRDDVSADW